MRVAFACPSCLAQNRVETPSPPQCAHCGWTRPLTGGEPAAAAPQRCLICGCEDLWRQKDFPPALGLFVVGCGIVASSIAWGMTRPLLAIGILMAFALVDLLLYTFMKDVLVCYRCHARHAGSAIGEEHPRFNLELNERYRQEASRLKQAAAPRD